MENSRTTSRQPQGVVLFGLAALLVVSLGAFVLLFTSTSGSASACSVAEQCASGELVARAALQQAFAEIVSGEDATGHGLGALGVVEPLTFENGRGEAIGEYRTFVLQTGNLTALRAIAAVPSFEQPVALCAAECFVSSRDEFFLAPRRAAVSLLGPLKNPRFPGATSETMHVEGGSAAAFSAGTPGAYRGLVEELKKLVETRRIGLSNFTGERQSRFGRQGEEELNLSVVEDAAPPLSAVALNRFRRSLRRGVERLAARASRVISSSVHGDQRWGTAGRPEVVLVDTQLIGSPRAVFDTWNQKIAGHGSLIVLHSLRPEKNLHLEWNGDVYVLGYEGDRDLVYLHGTRGVINGNLLLLSDERTDASLEIRDSKHPDHGRPADLTVNGSVLLLAEASSREVELEVEKNSQLRINGFLGAFARRIELEASGAGTELDVRGAVSLGKGEGALDGNDLEFEMSGQVRIVYDERLVEQAVRDLSELLSRLHPDGDTPDSYSVKLSVSAPRWADARAVETLLEESRRDGDLGLRLPR